MDPQLLFLGAVVNRIIEALKQALPADADNPTLAEWKPAIFLVVSFVLGALGVILFFPTANLFPQAASLLAGQIATGVVIGGIANGIDFLSGVVQQRASASGGSVSLTAQVQQPASLDKAA